MSKLQEVSSPLEAKRDLKGVNFDFTGAHVCYTDASQGGAASGLNDPVLLKSSEGGAETSLTEEQRELISLIGETPTTLDKTKGSDNLSKQQENTPIMGDQVSQEDFLALKKELALEKSLRAIEGLGLEDDVSSKLADALSKLTSEDLSIVKSAFTLVKGTEVVVEELTDLQKAALEEDGHEGEGGPQSLAEQITLAKADKEAK